jgi:hypothetical protein
MREAAASLAQDAVAVKALALRDQALAALDAGDPVAALAVADEGLAALEAAGLGNGPDAAAVLAIILTWWRRVTRWTCTGQRDASRDKAQRGVHVDIV